MILREANTVVLGFYTKSNLPDRYICGQHDIQFRLLPPFLFVTTEQIHKVVRATSRFYVGFLIWKSSWYKFKVKSLIAKVFRSVTQKNSTLGAKI